jgi:hypothetical protein
MVDMTAMTLVEVLDIIHPTILSLSSGNKPIQLDPGFYMRTDIQITGNGKDKVVPVLN